MEAFQWKAIQLNDSDYDGTFFYALKSTGTFCRPSCPSRTPNKKNVRIFYRVEEAKDHGYRACKRCRPECVDWQGSKKEIVLQVKNYIINHYEENLTLHCLAQALAFNPYHLHRTFKQATGLTPLQFLHQTRVEKAGELLSTSSLSATEISFLVGFTSLSHFSKVFKDKTCLSPSAFRKMNAKFS